MMKMNFLNIIVASVLICGIVYFVVPKIIDSFYLTGPLYNANIISESPLEVLEVLNSKEEGGYDSVEYVSKYEINYPTHSILISITLGGYPNVEFYMQDPKFDGMHISNYSLEEEKGCIYFGDMLGSLTQAEVSFTPCTLEQIENLAINKHKMTVSFDVLHDDGSLVNSEEFEIYIEQNGYYKVKDSL